MFRIGQKVVCVDDVGTDELKVGNIYTVKFCDKSYSRWRGKVGNFYGVLLYEAKPTRGYQTFCGERFRPVDERKTDISIFKKMLKPSKAGVDA